MFHVHLGRSECVQLACDTSITVLATGNRPQLPKEASGDRYSGKDAANAGGD